LYEFSLLRPSAVGFYEYRRNAPRPALTYFYLTRLKSAFSHSRKKVSKASFPLPPVNPLLQAKKAEKKNITAFFPSPRDGKRISGAVCFSFSPHDK
jgi:hypothetical protein